MNIALVQCPNWARYMPPLPLGYICAILRQEGHTVRVFDFNIEFFHTLDAARRELWRTGQLHMDQMWRDTLMLERMFPTLQSAVQDWAARIIESETEFVAFSVVNTSQALSLRLAGSLKSSNPRMKVAFGGYNFNFPHEREQALRSGVVDALVVGEGELTILDLVDQLERYGTFGSALGTAQLRGGEGVMYPERPLLKNLDGLPYPDFTDFDLDKYESHVPKLPIAMSRGCIRRCVFCSEWVSGKVFRSRSGKDVFQEICRQMERHPHVRYFNFNDSLINGEMRALRELVSLLNESELGIQWEGNAIATPLMTPAFLREMRQAGCRRLVYGIESGSQRVLDGMRKGLTVEVAERVLRDTHEADIEASTNWIVGFPTEREEDFRDTLDFIERVADCITIPAPWGSKAVLIPGTTLTQEHERFGILNESYKMDWDGQWITADGMNGMGVREDRHRRFLKHIQRLGVLDSES